MRAYLLAFPIFVNLIAVVGCRKANQVPIESTSLPASGSYELVWVNPKVVYSDSSCTLIRADRIDSIFVRKKERQNDRRSWSTRVPNREACLFRVELVSVTGDRYPLLETGLSKGEYKLTIDHSRTSARLTPAAFKVHLTGCGPKRILPLDPIRR